MRDELMAINKRLGEIFEVLKTANEDGQQMDHLTHPSIATQVDLLNVLTRKISKIMYQEK